MGCICRDISTLFRISVNTVSIHCFCNNYGVFNVRTKVRVVRNVAPETPPVFRFLSRRACVVFGSIYFLGCCYCVSSHLLSLEVACAPVDINNTKVICYRQ